MKITIQLICFLLFKFIVKGKCDITVNINPKNQSCSFSLSNGGYEEFLNKVSLLKECTRRFQNPSLEIKLINYTLPAFPNETFTDLPNLRTFRLEVSNGTQIQLLSPQLPNYFVFENIKFNTAEFDISDSANVIGWRWEALSKVGHAEMKYFKFSLFRTKLIRLASDFGNIANGRLTTIRIMSCQLRWLSKNVFGPHSNLIVLELKDNFIEKFERFHLPQNPSKLKVLDLGDNRLQYISQDVFTNLKLDMLFLNGNNLKILSNQLKSINEVDDIPSIYGALWPCDCSNILKLFERLDNYFLLEKCYLDEKIIEIGEFKKSCNQQNAIKKLSR